MRMENNIKIIHWNIASCSIDNREKIKDIVYELEQQEADIIVISEATTAQNEIIEKLMESKREYFTAATNNRNKNGIVIIVSSKKIGSVIFEDFREKQNEISPDRLLAKIYLKNGQFFSILGVRFRVSNLNNSEKEQQFNSFKWEVDQGRPDIIIGDFNWNTAILPVIRDFKDEIGNRKYKLTYWPTDKEESECYSYKAKKGIGYTRPDRVCWNAKNVELVSREYYVGLKEKDEFPVQWPSDHSMIVTTFVIITKK